MLGTTATAVGSAADLLVSVTSKLAPSRPTYLVTLLHLLTTFQLTTVLLFIIYLWLMYLNKKSVNFGFGQPVCISFVFAFKKG